MTKRTRRPAADEIRHADLEGGTLPAEESRIISVRISAWHLQIWRQLRKEFPEISPTDTVRRALLVAAATSFKDEAGQRPDVFLEHPDGKRVRLETFLGLDGSGNVNTRVIPVNELRGAAKPSDEESYGITLRVFGFFARIYDQLERELGGTPSEVIRRCLVVLAATVLRDSDGREPAVFIRPPGTEQAERLDDFLGFGGLTKTTASAHHVDAQHGHDEKTQGGSAPPSSF